MVKIVADSSCDLPFDLVKEYDISIVPLNLELNGTRYKEGIDISAEELWDKMRNSPKLPKTSQPSPGEFARIFTELQDNGDDPLCITISSKLSGTFQSAVIGGGLSKDRAVVFDSLAGSLGHGVQVLKAARLAMKGKTIPEIISTLKKHREEMKIIISLDTLENIVKGGRMSKIQGGIARILNMKVLLQGIDGEVKLMKKLRGNRKMRTSVLDLIAQAGFSGGSRIFGITHVNNPAEAEFYRQEISKMFNPPEIVVAPMGPVIATYAGDGGMLITY